MREGRSNTASVLAWVAVVASLGATLVSHLWTTADLGPFFFTRTRYFATLRQSLLVPVEFWIAVGTIVLLTLRSGARRRGRRDVGDAYSFLLSIPVLGGTLGLLSAYPWTLSLWVVGACVAGLLTTSSRQSTEASIGSLRLALADLRGRFGSTPWSRLVVVALAAALAVQTMGYRVLASPRDQAAQRELVAWFRASRPLGVPELQGDGAARLVVFTDHQCSVCAAMVPLYKSVVSAAALQGHNVELILKDFPLDAECNPLVGGRTHALACKGAAARRLVEQRRADASEAFEHWLYERGNTLTVDLLQGHLATLGLADEWRIRYAELLDEVRADTILGARIGVSSTPTAFLNGVKLPMVRPAGLEALLRALNSAAAPAESARRNP